LINCGVIYWSSNAAFYLDSAEIDENYIGWWIMPGKGPVTNWAHVTRLS